MDLKNILQKNKEYIEANALSSHDVIDKNDDWYNENCWDEYHDELKGQISRDEKN